MSEEDDFDEFPSISVNSSIHESSWFSMPSAEALAAQRAREDACELELLRLREEHLAADRECGVTGVAGATHSDSSGSEGEAALAAAAAALQLRAPPAPRAPRAPAARLLAALAPRLPRALQPACLAAARAGGAAAVQALARELASGASEAAVEAAGAWGSDELVALVAWLGAGALGAGAGRAALRTLHLLVEEVATETQMEELRALLVAGAAETGAALELSDALRSGGARGEALAHAVARAALAHLAALPDPQECSMDRIVSALPGAWRCLQPPHRYLALQLLARLLPRGQGQGQEGERARTLLEALAQPAPGQRSQTTDTLKVLVAATKLQVLFHVKQSQ